MRWRRMRSVGLVAAYILTVAAGQAVAGPQVAVAASGTVIHVPGDCPASTPGQSLVDALQAAQDGNASGECTGLGTGLNGPYTILLDPTQTYVLTQVNNDSDGPDGLPAVIDQVTLQSAVPGLSATIERQTGAPPFRFFDVAAPQSTSCNVASYAQANPGLCPQFQTPGDVAGQTTTIVPYPGGSLTLQDIALTGGLAQGGGGTDCGGGGAGLGGAIFVHGGSVTLADSLFVSNAARGGPGGAYTACTGGGGGMGAAGGNGYGAGSGGGGGGMSGAGQNATASGSGGGGGPNAGGPATSGGYGGGGGGSSASFTGNGGFGGGGGGGSNGGNGGFGGGGGGADAGTGCAYGGWGGFGGGGGGGVCSGGGFDSRDGGFGAGQGDDGGGGGAGLGGAVFVLGGNLTIVGSTFQGNSAAGGSGGGQYTTVGSGYGGAIFMYGVSTADASSSEPSSGAATLAITGSILGGPVPNTASPAGPDVFWFGDQVTVQGQRPGAGSATATFHDPQAGTSVPYGPADVPGPAAALGFVSFPSGGVAVGAPFPVQPVVEVVDADGNVVTSDTSSVTLSLEGSAGGQLSGAITVVAQGGVARFGGLSVDTPGFYALRAEDGALLPATSSDFYVGSPPGPPTDVTATAGDGQVLMSWQPPLSDGGSPVTGYTVSCNPGNEAATVTGVVYAKVSGLTGGVSYVCTVAATNAVGTGPTAASNPVTPTGPAQAGVPVVDGLTPAFGLPTGGASVQISGSNLDVATAVYFGSQAATFTVDSPTQITTVSPAEPAGTVDVTVVAPDGRSALVPADRFTYRTVPQVVTRELQPGWNTLSLPFALADPSLPAILSDGGASLVVAYAYVHGGWQQVTAQNESQLLSQPMVGMYLKVTQPVTATLSAASSPEPPPALPLAQGWNLVGPSALAGQESYADFLVGVPPGSVPELVDPNGAGAVSTDPGEDTADVVTNGAAYWVFGAAAATLAGQIPTGQAH